MRLSLTHRVYFMLDGAWRRRYLIAIPILLLPLIGLAIGITTPKKYSAHTSMLIQETAKMNPFLEDLAVSSMLKERMAALQTLLHSRHILGAVAMELGLLTEDSPASQHDRAVNRLSAALSMQMAGKDLIRIDMNSDNPLGMKETLETVSRHFVEQLLAPERSSIRDSSSFLQQHLTVRRASLDKAEQTLAEFKDKYAEELPEQLSSNLARLSQLKQLKAEREATLAGVKRSFGTLQDQLSKTNPVIGKLEEQIVSLRSDLALLRARYTDEHSKVQAVMRQLRRIEEERQRLFKNNEQVTDTDKLWDMASSLSVRNEEVSQPLLVSQLQALQESRSQIAGYAEELESLKGMIKQLEEKTKGSGERERTLIKLQRDLKVERQLYEELLQRYEMAGVTGSLGDFEQGKRIKVIDQPFTPSRPSSLPVWAFVVGGAIAGLFMGIGLAVVMELTDSTVRRRDLIEELTGLPVISRIPPQQL